MSKTIKNHFLHEAYQKGFLNGNMKLFCYKKINGKWVFDGEKTPAQIMFKRKDHPQLHENYLSKLETKWSPVLKKIQKLELDISQKEKEKLAEFIVWQFERVPNTRKIAKKYNQEQIEIGKDEIKKTKDLSDFQKKVGVLLWDKLMNDEEMTLRFRENPTTSLKDEILSLNWNFFIASSNIGFLTTDDPFRNHFRDKEEVTYFMPLSKKVMVWIFANKKSNKNYILDLNENQTSNLNWEFVKIAREYIVGPNKDEIEKLTKRYNEIFDKKD